MHDSGPRRDFCEPVFPAEAYLNGLCGEVFFTCRVPPENEARNVSKRGKTDPLGPAFPAVGLVTGYLLCSTDLDRLTMLS